MVFFVVIVYALDVVLEGLFQLRGAFRASGRAEWLLIEALPVKNTISILCIHGNTILNLFHWLIGLTSLNFSCVSASQLWLLPSLPPLSVFRWPLLRTRTAFVSRR